MTLDWGALSAPRVDSTRARIPHVVSRAREARRGAARGARGAVVSTRRRRTVPTVRIGATRDGAREARGALETGGDQRDVRAGATRPTAGALTGAPHRGLPYEFPRLTRPERPRETTLRCGEAKLTVRRSVRFRRWR